MGASRQRFLAGGVVAGVLLGASALSPATGAEQASIPNFAPNSNVGWVASGKGFGVYFVQPPSGPGPVTNDPAYPVDNYRTPHTTQLHVIERFKLIDGGRTIEVSVHVEHPGAFTTPWNAIQRYRRTEDGPITEMVCAENNVGYFSYDVPPIPQADKPDF
jgi:hypothetical protein